MQRIGDGNTEAVFDAIFQRICAASSDSLRMLGTGIAPIPPPFRAIPHRSGARATFSELRLSLLQALDEGGERYGALAAISRPRRQENDTSSSLSWKTSLPEADFWSVATALLSINAAPHLFFLSYRPKQSMITTDLQFPRISIQPPCRRLPGRAITRVAMAIATAYIQTGFRPSASRIYNSSSSTL